MNCLLWLNSPCPPCSPMFLCMSKPHGMISSYWLTPRWQVSALLWYAYRAAVSGRIQPNHWSSIIHFRNVFILFTHNQEAAWLSLLALTVLNFNSFHKQQQSNGFHSLTYFNKLYFLLQTVVEARKNGLVGNPVLAHVQISMVTQCAWTPLGAAGPAVVRVTWSSRMECV